MIGNRLSGFIYYSGSQSPGGVNETRTLGDQINHSSKDNFKYWAFISYSHRDDQVKWPWQRRWGSWLHRSLESFRIPANLVGKESPLGKIPPRLVPVFRDRDELPSSANLQDSVREALEQSRTLIVICSPDSARSQWVNEEVLTFKRLNRSNRILALIIRGEPNANVCACVSCGADF